MEREIRVIKAMKTEDKKLRIAAYCRVSSDSKDQVNSFLTQIKYYHQLIKNTENAILVDIYADEGISGTMLNKREEMKRLIKDCQNKKIDRVYVKSITRFARNSVECIQTIRLLKENGVSIYFENDNIDTQYMNSEMLIYIKSSFAQEEAIAASKRMRMSVKMRLENGTYKNSNYPYGYQKVDDEIKINESEEKIIKQIYQLYLSGYGYAKIVKYLQENYPNTKWIQSHIEYILKNEKYIGDSLFQKTYYIGEIPFRKKINQGEKTKYYFHNTHQAIIEKDIFQKVQELREQKRKIHYKISNDKHNYLFNRIIKCGECGNRYKAKKTKEELHWYCSKKGLSKKNCNTPIVTTTKIKKDFIHLFNKLKQNQKIVIDDTIELYQKVNKKLERKKKEIALIEEELVMISKQNAEYIEMFNMGVIDEITYYQKNNQIKKKILELKKKKESLVLEEESEEFIHLLKKIKSILNNYPQYMTIFDKKVFSEMIEKIIVTEDKINFILKGGLELRNNQARM